jgi:hypothetical protein
VKINRYFFITFIVVFAVIGLISVVGVEICFVEGASAWARFREYFKVAVFESFIVKLLVAFILAFAANVIAGRKRKS